MAWAGGAACELPPPPGVIGTLTFGHSDSHSSAHSGHAQFRLRIAEPGIDKRHGNPSICFLATFPGSSMKGRKWTWNSSSSCLSNSRARAASRAA